MALTQIQIESLRRDVYHKYSEKIDQLYDNYIKEVKESEEYKNAEIIINSALELFIDDEKQLQDVLEDTLNKVFSQRPFNKWNLKDRIENRIVAILATLPEGATYEYVIKTVDATLNFDLLVKEETEKHLLKN